MLVQQIIMKYNMSYYTDKGLKKIKTKRIINKKKQKIITYETNYNIIINTYIIIIDI